MGQDLSVGAAEKAKAENLETGAVYEHYRAQVKIVGAQPHPTPLSESAAMASVNYPPSDYKPAIPRTTIENGNISEAQLEAVINSGAAHERMLDNGNRRGYFIGDGTGVGKGRTIASILWDNWNRGRKKSIWLTADQKLFPNAQGDIGNIGWDPSVIFPHRKTKTKDAIQASKGILFTAYSLLRDPRRRKQIEDWLGKDFDGLIVFDESHKMGNALDTKASRGVKKASKQALAGLELQKAFPNARVLYVSATGATEVSNLAYAERLGLWGEGTPFANVNKFVNDIGSKGMAAMEIVAKDLKSSGLYISRNLSFDGVTYDRVDHTLTPKQRDMYDTLAEAWQVVLRNINAALEVTEAANDSSAKSAAKSQFWGAHQRFFNQILTSFQLPTAVEAMKRDLANGDAVVVQFVNTNESAMERALSRASEASEEGEEQDLESLDITPREGLMKYVQDSFPVDQYETFTDENGNEQSRPVLDSQGNRVKNAEAVAMRDALLEKLGSVRVPMGALDELIETFGVDNVAEVTGRSRRVVTKDTPEGRKKVIENRSQTAALADRAAFNDDKKKVLLFNDAGGTGASYHADLAVKNQRMRRHYILQPGWRADNAIQGLGRTHRSNQKQPPQFRLTSTDVPGHKRFVSSVARRIEQLGALTKAQRQTTSQGVFSARDNLESSYSRDALRTFLRGIASGRYKDITVAEFERQTGLKLVNEDGQFVGDQIQINQFLNRLLSLKLDMQSKVFDAFSNQLDAVIEWHKSQGTLDVGMETLSALKTRLANDETLFTDPETGAQTKLVDLELTHPTELHKWEPKWGKDSTRFIVRKGGGIWALIRGGQRALSDGSVESFMQGVNPRGNFQYFKADDLRPERIVELDKDQARQTWDTAIEQAPKTWTQHVNLVTGSILPVWDRIPGFSRIARAQDEAGNRHLGVVIHSDYLGQLRKNFGLESKVELSPKEAINAVLDENATLVLSNGWRINRKYTAGEWRVEITGPDYSHTEELKKRGVFTEMIAFTTRYFIKSGAEGEKTLEAITKTRPIVEVLGRSASGLAETPISYRADKLADSLEKLKLPGAEGGNLHAFGVVPALWNSAVSAAQTIIRAGGSVADAVAAAIEHIKKNWKGTFDEAGARLHLEKVLSGEEVARAVRLRRHNFGGVRNVGEIYEQENIAQIQNNIRANYFDGTKAPTKELTEQAWQILDDFTGDSKGAASDIVRKIGQGGQSSGEMAPGLLQAELRNYALKLMAQGDPSLMNALLEKQADFQTIAKGGDGGDPQAARTMRAAQEFASGPFWKRLKEYTEERNYALGRRWGVGTEFVDQLMESISRIKLTPDDVDKGATEIQRIIDDNAPERKAAADIANQFGPPKQRATVLETVYEWMKNPWKADDKEGFVSKLADRLRELRVGAPNILTDTQARVIAEATWDRKWTVDGEQRRRAWDRELRRLDSMADKTAEGFMKRFEGAEWVRPESPNEVRWIVTNALKSKTPISENQPGPFTRPLREALIRAGVSEEKAIRLANDIYNQRIVDWSNARLKAMETASKSKSLRSLTESILTTPYRAQSDPDWLKETARQWFMSNGLSREQAEVATQKYQQQFKQAYQTALEKAATQFLTTNKRSDRLEDVLRSIRLGLTDPDKQWSEAIAARSDFRPLTREQHAALAKLEQDFSDPYRTLHEKVNITEKMMGIYRHVGDSKGHFIKAIAESLSASLLSGFKTIFLHVFQPGMNMLATTLTQAVYQPRDFPTAVRGLYETVTKSWWPEAVEGWSKDAFSFNAQQKSFYTNELKRRMELVNQDWQGGRYGKALVDMSFGISQYVGRALQTANQAAMAVVQEQRLMLYGSSAMRAAGLGTREISQMVDVQEGARQAAFTYAKEKLGKTDGEAGVYANEHVAMALHEFFSSVLNDAKANEIARAVENDVYSVVGRRSPTVHTDTGVGEGGEGGHVSKLPRDIIASFAQMRAKGGGESIAAITMIGFAQVPFRLTRFYAGWTPYGFFRYFKDKSLRAAGAETYWKQSYGNQIQAQQRLREAIIGTAMMGFLGLAASNSTMTDDDLKKKGVGFVVTALGPKNRDLRDAWNKLGYQPLHLHVILGGRIVGSIPITRVGEVLGYPAGVAAALDDIAWRKKEQAAKEHGKPVTIGQELMTLAGTYYEIAGAQGIFQAGTQLTGLRGGQGNMGQVMAQKGASLAGGLIPFHGLVNSLTDVLYGQVDRSNLLASMAANFAGLNAVVNGKAVNRFGDPIGDRSWYAKVSRMGLLAVRLSDNPENRELYSALLDKGVGPEALKRTALEDTYRPLSQEEWNKFTALSGQKLKEAVLSRLDILKTMPAASVQRFLNEAAKQSDARTASDMGLERTKPGRQSAGVQGGSDRPEVAAPRIPSAGGSGGGGGRIAAAPAAVSSRGTGGPRRVSLGRGRGGGGRRLVSGRLRSQRIRAPRASIRHLRLGSRRRLRLA